MSSNPVRRSERSRVTRQPFNEDGNGTKREQAARAAAREETRKRRIEEEERREKMIQRREDMLALAETVRARREREEQEAVERARRYVEADQAFMRNQMAAFRDLEGVGANEALLRAQRARSMREAAQLRGDGLGVVAQLSGEEYRWNGIAAELGASVERSDTLRPFILRLRN